MAVLTAREVYRCPCSSAARPAKDFHIATVGGVECLRCMWCKQPAVAAGVQFENITFTEITLTNADHFIEAD